MQQELKAVLKRLGIYGKLIYDILCSLKLTKRQKLLLGAGFAYLISPIDLIPGIIPILGQLDDIIVTLTVLVKILKELAPETRTAYLQKFALTLEMIESDLAYVKRLAAEITKKTILSSGRVLNSGRKAVFELASGGLLSIVKAAAGLAVDRKKQHS